MESEVGHGSAFTARLPRAAPGRTPPETAPDAGAEIQMPAASPAAPAMSSRGASPPPDAPVVLVAEDNADVRAYLRRHLSSTYRIWEAENGAEALSMIHETLPTLVICDVMMPEMDGLALCNAIKSDETLRALPVLMLTAKATPDDTVAGLECGADDYLTKPFDICELKQRIVRLLNVRTMLKDEYQGTLQVEGTDIEVADAEATFMQVVLGTLEEHLGDAEFSVDRLAQSVALSRRQLTRRLREATGESPAAFIRGYRLDRAAEHLADGYTGTIAELAYNVGFGSASYFSTAFKRRFDCSPSQYPPELPENGAR